MQRTAPSAARSNRHETASAWYTADMKDTDCWTGGHFLLSALFGGLNVTRFRLSDECLRRTARVGGAGPTRATPPVPTCFGGGDRRALGTCDRSPPSMRPTRATTQSESTESPVPVPSPVQTIPFPEVFREYPLKYRLTGQRSKASSTTSPRRTARDWTALTNNLASQRHWSYLTKQPYGVAPPDMVSLPCSAPILIRAFS